MKPLFPIFSTFLAIFSSLIDLSMNLRATENLFPHSYPKFTGLKTLSKDPSFNF
jgi:hypothetical protein